MSLIKKYLEEFENVNKKVTEELRKLNEKQSEIDKKISEMYHEIEQSHFNVVEGYFAYKKLRGELRKRRAVKEELTNVSNFIQQLETKGLNNRIHKAKKKIDSRIERFDEYRNNWEIDIEAVLEVEEEKVEIANSEWLKNKEEKKELHNVTVVKDK